MTLGPPSVPVRRPTTAPLPSIVLARDLTPAAVQAAVRTGALERVRPGAFRRPVVSAAGEAAVHELALARIAAIDRQLRTPFSFSHESAALVWGVDLWRVPSETHIIQTVRPHRGGDRLLTRHVMTLDPHDRVQRRGLPVTSLDRTVVDCLRRLPPLDGLVIADSALRIGADGAAIVARLEALAGERGTVIARTVMQYADGRAESPWETRVRHVLVSFGLPRPELQVTVHTRLGWFRSDLGWTEWKLLVEFDGFTKYSTLARGDPARVVFEERRRQDAIEEEGWRVLRVTAADPRRPAELVQRICRYLPPAVTAHLTPVPALRAWT